MTNKTREKLKRRIDDILVNLRNEDISIFDAEMLLYDIVTQSENRILRKWKKAIEKLPGGTGFNATYFDIMYEEYLKAKENKV